jgi:NADH-quinone oxidoreductase subunit F
MEKPLTGNLRSDGLPLTLEEYKRDGGYRALAKVLRGIEPKSVTRLVWDSGLRGRGGAGFLAGHKWSLVPMYDGVPRPKYFVVNGDEMEPGTFKDRLLLEGNPHQVLEGAMIAAYAIQADILLIFLRMAYREAAERLKKAIAETYAEGLLGKNILGSNYSLEAGIHVSAGRYMCGEETAMLSALEGGRGMPRAKPPYPPVVGLFGKPTGVNNVETVCCIPHIVNNGIGWFKGLSRTGVSGTKIYGLSGRVKRPGLWELPMGTPLREILEEHAGGMQDGYRFRAAIPGGASTEFMLEEHLDTPMDFDAVPTVGSRLGTGTIIVMDDRTCPVGMALNLERFFARESCGWCTPCRDGLPWIERMLQAIEEGEGRKEDLDTLAEQCRRLQLGNTFCALAPGAAEPLQSALVYFREDFEQHIREKQCPWRKE